MCILQKIDYPRIHSHFVFTIFFKFGVCTTRKFFFVIVKDSTITRARSITIHWRVMRPLLSSILRCKMILAFVMFFLLILNILIAILQKFIMLDTIILRKTLTLPFFKFFFCFFVLLVHVLCLFIYLLSRLFLAFLKHFIKFFSS